MLKLTVASLFRFEDEADAIRLDNDTEYGLASYFYARDVGRVLRVAEALEYGMVGVNTEMISTELTPSAALNREAWAGKVRTTGLMITSK